MYSQHNKETVFPNNKKKVLIMENSIMRLNSLWTNKKKKRQAKGLLEAFNTHELQVVITLTYKQETHLKKGKKNQKRRRQKRQRFFYDTQSRQITK